MINIKNLLFLTIILVFVLTGCSSESTYKNLQYTGMYKVIGTSGQFATFKDNENQNVAVKVDPSESFNFEFNKLYSVTVSGNTWRTYEGFVTSATEVK